ncbi:unnamed protein product [Schistosoma mattheei]|uniref:Uncharacterized protein n=1 Tax=Schistosoma mattheei TaxID=31246 RepID=A0A183PNI4_9TREM|nr:unnamed protein product [Schistosoma mattheei]
MIQRNHQFNNLKLGIKLSLITNAQYRYEGILAGINLIDNTIILKNVKFFGYENRIPPPPPPDTDNNNKENLDHNHDPDQQINNKIPIIGTIFDSITFWISSIHQIYPLNSMKSFNQYELNNKTMIKTNSSIRNDKEKHRRYNSLVSFVFTNRMFIYFR